MKTQLFASILAIGLVAGTALAQTGTTGTQTHHGAMMNGQMMGPGMMNGHMKGPDMMNGHMKGPGMMGMGCNGMMGGGMMMQMTPQQRQQFMDQTTDLRRQMMEKRFSYMEAMRNPATTPKDLAKIEKGMLELRAKMMDKMSTMHSK